MSEDHDKKDADAENVLLDKSGKPADEKARFEISRKVVGRKVTGLRFCSDDEFEPGRRGTTVTFGFEDGGAMMIAVPDGAVELFVSMNELPGPPKRVM